MAKKPSDVEVWLGRVARAQHLAQEDGRDPHLGKDLCTDGHWVTMDDRPVFNCFFEPRRRIAGDL